MESLEETEVDLGCVATEDDVSSVQTVYTNLTPVTIQDANGLRQIYVPVEQADTLTSLAEPLAQSSENQQFPLSGIPGQLITITLPGTTGASNHFQVAEDGTLLSVHDSVLELPVAEGNKNKGTDDEHREETDFHLPDACSTTKNQPEENLDESEASVLHDLLVPESVVPETEGQFVELSTQCKDNTPVDTVLGKEVSVQSTSKVFAEVFSRVEASLSEALLNAIPGSRNAFLKTVEKECRVELKEKDDKSYSFVCSTSQIVPLHEKLSAFLPDVRNPFQKKNSRHKGVNCDLLRPMFSRSGREVKLKQLELPVDDEPAHVLSETEERHGGTVRKKRGRPPKQTRISDLPKPSVSTIAKAAQSNPKHGGRAAPNTEKTVKPKPSKVTSEVAKVLMNNRLSEKSAVNLPNVDIVQTSPDHDPNADNLSQSPAMGDLSQQDLNESMKILMRPDEDKAETENLTPEKVTTLKPVKKSVTVLPRRRQKKDYESLLPFKYFCNQCSFKSKRQSHYTRHMQLHDRGLPLLRCNMCSFTTIRLGHLRRHTLFHTSELHHCQSCKYKTYDLQHLSRHIKVKHPLVRSTVVHVYECPMCQYVTRTEFQYKRHLKVHADVLGGEENPNRIVASYQCPVCEYTTKKKDHFARHMKQVHTEHRPYLCDLCGKSFKRQDTLRSHKVIHQDKSIRRYPFRCNTCNKEFRTQAHLNEHLSTHSNARLYLCEICGASFKTRNVQRKHVRTIHRNPRSYKCPDCDKSFNTKFALQRHSRTHDTPDMRRNKEDAPDPTALVSEVGDLTVENVAVQNLGTQEEEPPQMAAIIPADRDQAGHSHIAIPISTEATVLSEAQQIAIPLSVDVPQGQELPATIQLGEATQALTLAEGTYEQDADGAIRQVVPHFIQTGEATATLLYVPNM